MDTMKAILDIENKAWEIENSIGDALNDIKNETDLKIKELSEIAETEGDLQIEKFRETIKAIAENEYNLTKAEMEEALSSLEEKYQANRENWIKEICDGVITGDKI